MGYVKDPAFREWVREHCSCAVIERGYSPHECSGRLTIHHVRSLGSPKDDTRILPLCQAHHQIQFGKYSIEAMGKTKWQAYWDIDIEAAISRYQRAYRRERHKEIPNGKDNPAI